MCRKRTEQMENNKEDDVRDQGETKVPTKVVIVTEKHLDAQQCVLS